MGTILIGDVGILQESYPLAHRLANVEVIEIADEMVYCFGMGQRSFSMLPVISIAQKAPSVNLRSGFAIEKFQF